MKPYKQTSSQSCLSVCLLLHNNENISRDEELGLLYEALKTTDPYAIATTRAFVKNYKKHISIHVDNNYFFRELQGKYEEKNLSFFHNKINAAFLDNLSLPYIVHVNTHSLLNTWDYSPHFVVVKSMTKDFFTIVEPATGTLMKIKKSKLVESISTLRERIHYCPLVIKVE